MNSNTKADLLAAAPIGVCYVAGAAEAAGHSVRVVDLCFSGNKPVAKLTKALHDFDPEVVGLSVRNIDNVNMLHPVSFLPEIVEIVSEIRNVTRVPLVVGGSAAGLMPEQILGLLAADYIIVSDGERSFIQLLGAIEAGRSPEEIPGVGLIKGTKFHLTPPELTDFKGPRPDLGRWVDVRPYQKAGSSYNIQTKRGCRHQCIYCTYNQSLEGNRLRLRHPEDVVDEIEEALFKYTPKTFEFVDSVFNDPVDHSIELLEAIIRRPWKTEFTAMGVHPKNLDGKYLDLMWRAGFRSFMITPESASQIMLRNYRKGFQADDVIMAAESINKTAFAAWWFFLIGGPGETNNTLQESLDFAERYLQKRDRKVTHVAHFFAGVRVYPGTRLWDIALKEGFVGPSTDPLETSWYISEELDLERAIQQMTSSAARVPEIYLGFDERILVFSSAAAIFFKLLGFPRPYWRYFRAVNRFGLMTGIRFMYRPPDMAGMMRKALINQGYKGRLVSEQAC